MADDHAPTGRDAAWAGPGVALMVAAMAVFAVQDAISRHLAAEHGVLMVVAIRYWFMALLALAWARRRGGIRAVAATPRPGLQIARGLLLAAEICVMVTAFVLLGLVESHAAFACYPLIVAALSGPLLGERVGRARWAAIGVGFLGVLLILRPGTGALRIEVLVPLLSAAMFALYGLLTRLASRTDGAVTSFFWTGIAGAALMTPLGLWDWTPMGAGDWGWMGTLCVTGALGHWLLIRAYEAAEASAVQPFAYLQLVFASAIGMTVFGERIAPAVAAGAAVVVAAGVFTLIRERRARR
jgi:drug/metabolite transporter (DMT)-like permease